MAVITPSVEHVVRNDVLLVTWAGVTEDDTCDPFEGSQLADRSVQVEGDFGSGGSIRIEGTLTPNFTYRVLTDPQANPLDFTDATRIEAITELVALIRPRVTAGTGVDVTICMLVRKPAS